MKTTSIVIVLAVVLAGASGCSATNTGAAGSSGASGGTGSSGGDAPPVDLPPGSVPADLVGLWSGARDGITQKLGLAADGTGTWTTSLVTEASGCLSFKETKRTGNFVVEDTKITIYPASVVLSEQECTPPATDTKQPATTEVLQWHRADNDPNMILIIDDACAAKYPGQENCNIAGCPIGLYCTSRLTRQ